MLKSNLNNGICKIFLFILFAIFVSTSLFAQSNKVASVNNGSVQHELADSVLFPYRFISNSQAEKIIGGHVHLKDSLKRNSAGYLRLQFTYLANMADSVTGLKGSLFCSYEKFLDETSAKRSYDLIKAENEKQFTISNLDDIGDEGFMVKDQMNFPFLMIRKSNRVFKFKIYNVANKSSFDEFMALSTQIVAGH